MLQKWKIILGNWINCYFEEDNKKDTAVTLDSLLNIISHLRENCNLDESKSSLLASHTFQEFILEKYPSFRFENGTTEPVNNDEIYMAASLLLFFVCVNSKDVDIKSAMCNKLSGDDQKIILKFTKCMMECPNISCLDLLTAITEACGQDIAAAEAFIVPETPPALRSLHSEVRRLQAALDAERFDRNYLQDELNRNQLKMERLLKEKEHYKQEIANLKLKTWCGQEANTSMEVINDNSSKLLKQLQEIEDRLVNVQEKLDDVQYERDLFKNKLEDLKQERDKWFALSEQESNRASHLAEELTSERRHVQSLQEVITELRQHNKLNAINTSSLECDDLDASMHSLLHNTSVCSEACANIIEVQLSEERAKIVLLKQQMQMLQDQLNDVTKKSEAESTNFKEIISNKDSDITNLKQQVNEETENNNTMKAYYDNEVTKLNNEVNELEQRLRDNGENSRRIIDSKMKEIQILQEEKLSLLQSLSDEITKSENIIRDLNAVVDHEKSSKLKMREEYERQVMKLNEKVSNRSNEIVELQNKIFEKGEQIEHLQRDLRKEKEEVTELQNQIQQHMACNDAMKKDLDQVSSHLANSKEECNILQEYNDKLHMELKNRDLKIDKIVKDFQNQEIKFNDEKRKLLYSLDEINATIETLQNQLQNEIQFKISVQNELSETKNVNDKFKMELHKLNAELNEVKSNNIDLDQLLIKERDLTTKQEQKYVELNEAYEIACKTITEKEEIIHTHKNQHDDELRIKNEVIDSINVKLNSEIAEKHNREIKCRELLENNEQLIQNIIERDNTVLNLQEEVNKLLNAIKHNELTIQKLETELADKKIAYENIQKEFDLETTYLKKKFNELDKCFEEFRSKSNNTIEAKESQIGKLKLDLENLQIFLKNANDKILVIENEKCGLVQQLEEIDMNKKQFEKEYLNKFETLNGVISQLNEEIRSKNVEIKKINNEFENVVKDNNGKIEDIKTYKSNIEQMENLCDEKDREIKQLHIKIEILETTVVEYQKELKEIIDSNSKEVELLKNENIQLHYTIEEDNSIHELMVKEKDKIIENLENEIKEKANNIKCLIKDFECEKNVWDKRNIDMEEQITISNENILQINENMRKFQIKLEENQLHSLSLENHVKGLTDEKSKLTNEIELLRNTYKESANNNDTLKDILTKEKLARECLEKDKENLIIEKKSLLKKIESLEDSFGTVTSERDSLLNEKAILVQQLMEEKSGLKIADERKEVLMNEKRNIEDKLEEFMEIKNLLEHEKECLAQQLVDERLSKELAETERHHVSELKAELEQKLNAEIIIKSELQNKISNITNEIDVLSKNNENEERKIQDMASEINNLKQKIYTQQEEIENLMIDIVSLKNDLSKEKYAQELLNKEKSLLKEENAKVSDLFQTAKMNLNKTESEKRKLEEQINEINENLSTEISKKQEEIKKLLDDFNCLKLDYKTLEENNMKFETVLSRGLNTFFETIKMEEICLPILEKYRCVKENRGIEENCNIVMEIVSVLSTELVLKKNLEKALENEDMVIKELSDKVAQKDKQVCQLEGDVKNLQLVLEDSKIELSKQKQAYTSLLEGKTTEIQHLEHENESLNHELNDLKVQLDVKVHSLKDKLIDNENLTDKLKKTYESQIDNLNMMISKLTNYLKDKTTELDCVRNEKTKLQIVIEDNNNAIKSLEEEVKIQIQNQKKLISDFESERVVLKNMVTVTETVMEDQKLNLNNIITEHTKVNETLQTELKDLKEINFTQNRNFETKLKEKDLEIENLSKKLDDVCKEMDDLILQRETLEKSVSELEKDICDKNQDIHNFLSENKTLTEKLKEYQESIALLEKKNDELKIKNDTNDVEFGDKLKKILGDLDEQSKHATCLSKENTVLEEKILNLEGQIKILASDKNNLEKEKADCLNKIAELNVTLEKLNDENNILRDMKNEHLQLLKLVDEKDLDIAKLEKRLEFELAQQNEVNAKEKVNLINKCAILEEYQHKAEVELENRQKEINTLEEELRAFTLKSDEYINEKDKLITEVKAEKDALINDLNLRINNIKYTFEKELKIKDDEVMALTNKLAERIKDDDIISILKKENEELVKAIGQRDTFTASSQDRSPKDSGLGDKERDRHHQVDNSSDSHSSMEINKTISDLEKIIQDKNRTITTLQSDISYLKTVMAESENKLLDVSKDLEISKENCVQLSNQLKKIVHQKNEEIAELKKQVTKMSVTENRATQIIKVSAKYQAIILKRIAEIKSNTVLKELTNFGNCDSDIRKGLNAGTVTMEDLENFLETTERHIRRCAEKQQLLQKERDRLCEVNRINESEIINMRKFLSELSVSIKTFISVKDLYAEKLSRVCCLQRTVRREILGLEGHVTDGTMCSLERSYAAVMQDMSECAMNLERWVERCILRSISPEKIKQAFTSDCERASLAPGSFQNAGLDVQIEELYKSFEKLLADVSRAKKDGGKDEKDITIMEVRAEYEDKLNRMKAQMKQIYKDQISVFREKQKKDMEELEQELQRTRNKLREYESHIKSLTSELWNVGEKFLMKKDEAEWLRKKQRSDSLMSLQHVHSSGLVGPHESSRASDAHSLRSLPVTNNRQKEERTLHMSDEEGEVFDNRYLKELQTPKKESQPPGLRLSELRWRNSLCPPHLKSSYPAETQFTPAVEEEDIKCINMSFGGRQPRKEVGITAYKKPGPPTPSKKAGRLSATDSELRESLRVDADPSAAARKTSTPSRIRSIFRSNKNDTAEGTPRTRRLSNIFNRKK